MKVLKFDVIKNATADVSIGKSGMFLHKSVDSGIFICKLCQLADEDVYTCLVEVNYDGAPMWKMIDYFLYDISDITDDMAVSRPICAAIDDMLDKHPEYRSTRGSEEALRPFKDVAELYSVYAKEKQWTLQADLQGDVVKLDTISAVPVFYKHRAEDCVRRVSCWGHNSVDGITWQEFFDHYELVTWYDFRTHDYASIPCGILEKN